MTTLPPLSPVASNSPSWLNSTQEMMSAVKMMLVSTVTRIEMMSAKKMNKVIMICDQDDFIPEIM